MLATPIEVVAITEYEVAPAAGDHDKTTEVFVTDPDVIATLVGAAGAVVILGVGGDVPPTAPLTPIDVIVNV